MARLRAALAERDDRLRDSKAETSIARAALQVSVLATEKQPSELIFTRTCCRCIHT